MMAAPTDAKRPRETLPEASDVMRLARMMWRRKDPYKEMSTATEDRDFRECFGCPAKVAVQSWSLLASNDYLPEGSRLEHLLWMLAFMRMYGKKKQITTMCGGVDYKTLMKWVLLFIEALACLEPLVVSKLWPLQGFL
jgi:hypothetical protein